MVQVVIATTQHEEALVERKLLASLSLWLIYPTSISPLFTSSSFSVFLFLSMTCSPTPSLSTFLSYSFPSGALQQVRTGEEKPSISPLPRTSNKLRSQQRHCFLFTKHLLITTRTTTKKPHDCYKITKVLPITKATAWDTQTEVFLSSFVGSYMHFLYAFLYG